MFLAVLVLLAVVGLAMLWMNRGGEAPEPGSFKHWVKNPDYQDHIGELLAKQAKERKERERQPPIDVSHFDEPAIKTLVEKLLNEKIADETYDALKALGPKAGPALLAALKDPRFHRGTAPGFLASDYTSPFVRVVARLGTTAYAPAVPTLVSFARHPEDLFRKYVAEALGSIATDACIEPLKILLADEDGYVRGAVMRGIADARKQNRCSAQFLAEMFEAIAPLAGQSDSSGSGSAASMLLSLDRDRAIPLLLSDRFFRAGNPALLALLRGLAGGKVPIPPEKLLGLAKEIKPKATAYPFDRAYGEILKILVDQNAPAADAMIREALAGSNKNIREDAAEALCRLHGIASPSRFVGDRQRALGFSELTKPQQVFFTVFWLGAEVKNGGFSQYFVNSSGDLAHEALKALEVIGAKHTHEILRQAMQLFGPKGPSPARSVRTRQLAALSKEQDTLLDKLNDDFYKDEDGLEVRLLLYAVANKEHFREPATND